MYLTGKQSASSTPLKRSCSKQVNYNQSLFWNFHLNTLRVQNKFSEFVTLENDVDVWKKLIQGGLPEGQLSFLLRAGSDMLPTPITSSR